VSLLYQHMLEAGSTEEALRLPKWAAYLTLSLVHNWILQDAQARHGDFDAVAGHHRPHAFRGPRGNQVSGQQRHGGGNKTEDDFQRKNKVARVALLPDLAVHAGFDLRARPGVHLKADHWPYRTERVESLGSRPLAIFTLQVARRDIVDAGVS